MTIRLPAEWEEQSASLLTWPHTRAGWDDDLASVEQLFMDVIRQLTDHQKVIITFHDEQALEHARAYPEFSDVKESHLACYIIPSNDCWARDFGPLTVFENDVPVLLDFRFDGWNRKYPHDLDNQISRKLHDRAAFGQADLKLNPVVLEGGSIDSNGDGCLLTTSSCLLEHGRNPGFTRAKFETLFRDTLGCDHVIWLEDVQLAGDDTDGHIDTLCRFVSGDTIIYQQCTDTAHTDFESLDRLEQQLVAMNRDLDHEFTLVPLPVPDKKFSRDGALLPASYVNFIIANDIVLVPGYQDHNDGKARNLLAECFPGREVITINAMPLVQQGGSLHCLAMHLPRGVRE